MKHPTEVTESLEILRIAENLRPPQKCIFIAIGKLLTEDGADLKLSDILMYWLRLSAEKREGLARLLQHMTEINELDPPYVGRR